MPGGRPRTFDEGEALERAVEVFWRQGYEGTSITDLTTAMGVNKPSLYSVFGGKADLFRRAIGHYAEHDMAYARVALEEPTALLVAQRFLRDNVIALTLDGKPSGCLSIQGGVSCSTENQEVAQFLAASRLAGEKAFADRFRLAVEQKDLPADADPDALARFLMVVSEGHAVHAAAGIPREALQQSAAIAEQAFEAMTR
ncbi:TetR/AcrR family transcriptional regulator [Streptomyces sp. SID13031]|uniref:TetR/AcrR family transcriptional regulator n=1 Tax=Streptomyces sp. SID13031 TaxID=2706046 RepID=UPI0013CA5FFF|nr:TetR/AcrR family transcriptional regulator [Streptomyces sp. SID13031]NEA31888.1 TetR/AcrR family transcriptional regulator [Streptomyces sp. SID13031]